MMNLFCCLVFTCFVWSIYFPFSVQNVCDICWNMSLTNVPACNSNSIEQTHGHSCQTEENIPSLNASPKLNSCVVQFSGEILSFIHKWLCSKIFVWDLRMSGLKTELVFSSCTCPNKEQHRRSCLCRKGHLMVLPSRCASHLWGFVLLRTSLHFTYVLCHSASDPWSICISTAAEHNVGSKQTRCSAAAMFCCTSKLPRSARFKLRELMFYVILWLSRGTSKSFVFLP